MTKYHYTSKAVLLKGGRKAYLMIAFIEGKTLELMLADASGPGPSQKKNPAALSMVR